MFANSETEASSTMVDVLEISDVPVLFSLPQVRNLGTTIEAIDDEDLAPLVPPSIRDLLRPHSGRRKRYHQYGRIQLEQGVTGLARASR